MKNPTAYLVLVFIPILLWKSNSYAQVPVAELVKDINAGKFDSHIGYLTKINETTALMFAEDEYYGRELWTTDGTSAGTHLVKDIAPGKNSSTERGVSATKPIVVDNTLYFLADDGIHGLQIWRSSGTEAGTYAVTNFSYKETLLKFIHLTEFQKEVYFWFTNGEGYDLYKTGGSIAKTILVKQFRYSSHPTAPVAFKTELYFTGWISGDVGFALWKTNGTQPGTVRVGPILPKRPTSLTLIGNHLYCFLQDLGDLWKTDGTVNGTGLIRNIDGAGYGVKIFLSKGQGYFWSKERASFNTRLWKTDGTLMGTMAISGEEHNNAIIAFKDRLYFSYQSKTNQGQELWTTDGTPESTKPFTSAFTGTNPSYLTETGNMMYYYANVRSNETHSIEGLGIWQSDGTPLGTRLIGQLGKRIGLPRFPHFYGSSFGIAGEEEGPVFVALGKYLLFIGQGDKYASNNEKAIGAELFRVPIPTVVKSAIINTASSTQVAESVKPRNPSVNNRNSYQIKNVTRTFGRKNSKGDTIASAKAEFIYPEFTDNTLNQLIRYKLVKGSTYEKEAQGLVADHKDMLSNYKDDEIGAAMSQAILHQKVTVIRETDHFLKLRNDYYGQEAGAVHGQFAENYWIYDKQKKYFLTLSDLFDNRGMADLLTIAEATFRKNEKLSPQTTLCKNYIFDKCKFALAQQFRLDDKSLTFVYNPYEGKSFSAGIWTLAIPYAKIQTLFRPEYGRLIEQETM
ncbi:DUF3298 domain-containing protein [Dyadobacter frigoris]|uniref:DUF3298 domain-containing protein n=1 Tax=Dyadobacter frigoris TaxID=2576211 RepID=A0A4U6D9W4_9BACT|nr:DUF3298 domain-containing protein [Dyadobacter frigoris]TKT93171.1 DUF3298 domain-containing protein [Dyadobacter frigoris]GLU54800.1 hypothetical protein Dfri01_42610 [Dyadobacter frigoris]